MKPFHECMNEYRKQIKKGDIKEAYKGLMEFMMGLRAHFESKYPSHFVSGSLYYGYMDMTYFSFVPEPLKVRKLKIAIVFVHDTFRFEAWLAGQNKQVQSKYWKLFKESDWDKYRVVATTEGVDAIVEHTLVADPDFRQLRALTRQIETAALRFGRDIERFLAEHPN